GGKSVKNAGVNFFTIYICGLSFVLSVSLAYVVFSGAEVYSVSFNQWAPISKMFAFDVGFTVNKKTVYMMLIVTFVSTLVHI
ncbi:NADH-quinone oxidoreductase subunit L, partial [Francisella tularensis subsp. holarctica]|nr:NADH-quinone oxidoreductase subunit L [Francisella tularensis subsp. holarctica]